SSSRAARRLRNSRARHYDFLPPAGVVEISVDRLSVAGLKQATAIADDRDRARDRTFYGWLVVAASEAAREGRRVVASPLAGNPYHADIVLPKPAAEDREEQVHHAQELADSSRWRGIAS
ncbi:MAG: hypothetical protein OXK81_01150, partial [Chloroflexota bacterium]|nr:hypothetical protein [Chloroflexota bacterium]